MIATGQQYACLADHRDGRDQTGNVVNQADRVGKASPIGSIRCDVLAQVDKP
jgi:hypothetical protein